MKRIFILILSVISFISCDDGDIIVTSFDLGDDVAVNLCRTASTNDPNNINYVFYKINRETNETMALRISTTDPILSQLTSESELYTYRLGNTNKLVYRRFDGTPDNSYFCNPIPPASPVSIEEFLGNDGTITIATLGDLDDNDGIAEEFEVLLNGSEDLDGDGIPNFYDWDDDGDNVPTSSEGVVLLEDGSIDYENSLDTDGDGIPNFMDPDDDGDGVLTRDEDKDGDLNPNNDVTDDSEGPDYLNAAVAVDYSINEYRENPFAIKNITLTIDLQDVTFTNQNADETILTDNLSVWTYEAASIQNSIKPEFVE